MSRILFFKALTQNNIIKSFVLIEFSIKSFKQILHNSIKQIKRKLYSILN